MSKRSKKNRSRRSKNKPQPAEQSPENKPGSAPLEVAPSVDVHVSVSPEDHDLELDVKGIDLHDPTDSTLKDFNVSPRVAEADRPKSKDTFGRDDHEAPAYARIEVPHLKHSEENSASGFIEFLATETLKKARRVDFLPQDHLHKPRYLPDDLPEGDDGETTAPEHSPIWGKQQVDTPKFDKFDDATAIKEGLRSVPVFGRTLISSTLSFRHRRVRWAALIIALATFGWGLHTIFQGVKRSEVAGSPPQAPQALGLYEPAVIKDIDELLSRYFAASSIEERLPLVRAAKHVRPLMEAYEREHGPEQYGGFSRDGVKAPAPYLDSVYFTVDVILEPQMERRRLVVERAAEDTYLLDWENVVGYQQMSWDKFKETRPTEPVTFRAVILPSDYYNFHFSSPQKWASWTLRHPVVPELLLFGYTSRNSDLTQEFLNETRSNADGPDTGTAVTLRLAYPTADGHLDSDQVEILEILRKGWVTPYPQD